MRIDPERAVALVPPRRALLSVSDKSGLADFAAGLVARGFELVSTGGTARALRGAGLPVTDVAAVTGFPEMLDGRVKTLHPRIHAGILADRRVAGHRAGLAEAGIEPFELVVVNLYPFAAAAERAADGELDLDGLIEEIDIGGPSMVRAAAKNLANVTIVTAPARYPAVLEALDTPGGLPAGLRAALAIEAFRHTAAYDARIAEVLPCELDRAKVALPDEPGLPRSVDPFPATLVVGLEKVETLRYGENPHQAAARYRRPGATEADGPFASGAAPLQGKPLSYNNILDASAASALGRALRGPACVIVKHTNPCGAAERGSLGGRLGRCPGGRSRQRLRRRCRADRGGGRGRSPSGSRPSSWRSWSPPGSTRTRGRSSRADPTCASSWTRGSDHPMRRRRPTGGAPSGRPAGRSS